ncbi:hypothetical protein C5470_10925 [Photorhabdus stackebrandtii]|uniref:Uncharacterized protein n=1 Tax=Photorhabdus stackebrandtii TaxID=1123042 RepID=A0A7X5QM01_9GAMM|nr:hypothetical protein [Photorhabdus stackebrandtii]
MERVASYVNQAVIVTVTQWSQLLLLVPFLELEEIEFCFERVDINKKIFRISEANLIKEM